MAIDPEELRRNCLGYAVKSIEDNACTWRTEDIVERARLFSDYVLGKSDGDVIAAAHNLAKAVNHTKINEWVDDVRARQSKL